MPTTTVYNTIKLNAKLSDLLGQPIPFAYINFILNKNVIATVNTDADGVASLLYTPLEIGNYNITAEFIGNEFYEGVSDKKILSVEPDFNPDDTTILESVVDSKTIARLTISPKLLDVNKPAYIKVEFIDKEDGSEIDMEYDLIVTKDDNILYESNNSTFHAFVPEEGNINISLKMEDKTINFNRNVVPEFEFYLIIASIAFSSYIILFVKKGTL